MVRVVGIVGSGDRQQRLMGFWRSVNIKKGALNNQGPFQIICSHFHKLFNPHQNHFLYLNTWCFAWFPSASWPFSPPLQLIMLEIWHGRLFTVCWNAIKNSGICGALAAERSVNWWHITACGCSIKQPHSGKNLYTIYNFLKYFYLIICLLSHVRWVELGQAIY